MSKLSNALLFHGMSQVSDQIVDVIDFVFLIFFRKIFLSFLFFSTALNRYHRVLCLGADYHNPNHPLNVLNEAWK